MIHGFEWLQIRFSERIFPNNLYSLSFLVCIDHYGKHVALCILDRRGLGMEVQGKSSIKVQLEATLNFFSSYNVTFKRSLFDIDHSCEAISKHLPSSEAWNCKSS